MKFDFFFTASSKVYSERLKVSRHKFIEVKPYPVGLVSGWETSKCSTYCQQHRTENSILTLKNAAN